MPPKAKEKPKAAPSQPAIPIKDLFTSLNKFIQKSNYEQAFKVAEQVLSTAPGDEDDLQCKIVTLIKADNVAKAFQIIQSSQKKIPIDSNFFKMLYYVAVLVGARRSSEVQRVLQALKVKPTSTYELAYSTAFSLIEKNNYTDAEQLLMSGRRVGQEALMEDNWADDEIEMQLSPLAVQLAYVQQVLGNTQETVKVYLDMNFYIQHPRT